MTTILVGAACLVGGFIGGFLVFRNNTKYLKKAEKNIRKTASTL